MSTVEEGGFIFIIPRGAIAFSESYDEFHIGPQIELTYVNNEMNGVVEGQVLHLNTSNWTTQPKIFAIMFELETIGMTTFKGRCLPHLWQVIVQIICIYVNLYSNNFTIKPKPIFTANVYVKTFS